MTDWKRAILLVEYDDGAANAYEFTDLVDATVEYMAGVGPRWATIKISGYMVALRKGSEIEREFIDAIDALATPRGDTDERGR